MIVVHGAMPPVAADESMVRFAEGEGDVLLATNIIESGLDVPRANTMIVWRPDRFGLAQLHQLRGRVGRGQARGVAYLLTDPARPLAQATRKRLETLESLNWLGAGFAISARDLDERGAGELFGEDQAGHIALVGTSLYQHLLSRALACARGGNDSDEVEPELNIAAPGHIPLDYVPEPEVRINLYARFARLAAEDHVDALEEEIRNRFGTPPEPVERLLSLARLRVHSRQCGVSRIDAGPEGIAVNFSVPPTEASLRNILGRSDKLQIRGHRLVWKQRCATSEDRLENAGKLLRLLKKRGHEYANGNLKPCPVSSS
jgi:transcription-repair coupling factor (superfamily II helicase)